MAHATSITLTQPLTTLLSREKVEEEAQRLGVAVRRRTVDIHALVWTLVLGFQEGARRSIASLHWAYQKATGHHLSRSSFYDRFTPQLATLLRQLAQEAITALGPAAGVAPPLLASFRQLLALDSTVVRLHAMLSRPYGACRANHTQAAAKLHVVMNILDGSPCQVKLTPERVHDQTPWRRVGPWVQDCLLLFDLGYFCYQLFDRLDHHGGFFLTRLKANTNPRIVAVHRQWRGRSIELDGKRLKEALPGLKRQVLDVEVEVQFLRRAYLGHQSRAWRAFRPSPSATRRLGPIICISPTSRPSSFLPRTSRRCMPCAGKWSCCSRRCRVRVVWSSCPAATRTLWKPGCGPRCWRRRPASPSTA